MLLTKRRATEIRPAKRRSTDGRITTIDAQVDRQLKNVLRIRPQRTSDVEYEPTAAANFLMHVITSTLSLHHAALNDAERRMLEDLRDEFNALPDTIMST